MRADACESQQLSGAGVAALNALRGGVNQNGFLATTKLDRTPFSNLYHGRW
jgi:hypothetical protein